MRIVFMGTPEFALPSLDALYGANHQIAAAVTQPDRPRGRGHRLQPTPVASRAVELGLAVHKPAKVRAPEFLAEIRALEPDAIVLVAFGQLIPPDLLNLPPFGCINLHPSLLPRYRGASPIHAPVLAGDEVTGVTTMFMDEGLDTGDIILQEEIPIGPSETAGDLHDRLAHVGARLLCVTLERLAAGDAPRIPQDDAAASYAPKVHKLEVDWAGEAASIARSVRGLSPVPGAFTYLEALRIKLLRAETASGSGGRAGEVVGVVGDGIIVACGEGRVAVTEVQPEGKLPMSGADFARGYRLAAGQTLGSSLDSRK